MVLGAPEGKTQRAAMDSCSVSAVFLGGSTVNLPAAVTTPGLPKAGMSTGTFYGGINRRDPQLAAIGGALTGHGRF